MTRDIITNKWFIGAIALLIIIAGACYLWYQHDTAPYRQEAAESAKLLRQQEAAKKVDTVNEAVQAAEKAPAESNTLTTEKSINGSTAEVENNTEAAGQQQSETSAQTTEAKDVPVSPFGFGPYPEVPADYPIPPDKFEWEFWGKTVKGELMSRVRIKLWNQGIRSDGASFENGKVYPNILGTVYVQWAENGEFIRRITGHPDDDFDAIEAALEAGQPPPEGITVLSRNEAGIDPYSFLELSKKE